LASFYIYKGPSRKPAEYDKLTLAEFVNGCLAIIQKCKNDSVREAMTSHLRDMMQDSAIYGFETVREYYGILLGEMEQKRITWSDNSAILELRRQYVQSSKNPKQETKGLPNDKKSILICHAWNNGSCREKSDHDGYYHLCSFCFKQGKKWKHTEKECRQKVPKNGAATYSR